MASLADFKALVDVTLAEMTELFKHEGVPEAQVKLLEVSGYDGADLDQLSSADEWQDEFGLMPLKAKRMFLHFEEWKRTGVPLEKLRPKGAPPAAPHPAAPPPAAHPAAPRPVPPRAVPPPARGGADAADASRPCSNESHGSHASTSDASGVSHGSSFYASDGDTASANTCPNRALGLDGDVQKRSNKDQSPIPFSTLSPTGSDDGFYADDGAPTERRGKPTALAFFHSALSPVPGSPCMPGSPPPRSPAAAPARHRPAKSPVEEEEDDDEDYGEVVSYKDLKNLDWSSQRGSALQGWLYLRPGGRNPSKDARVRRPRQKAKAILGHDYFLDEKAALEFAQKWRCGFDQRSGHVDELAPRASACESAEKAAPPRERKRTFKAVQREEEPRPSKRAAVPKGKRKERLWKRDWTDVWRKLSAVGWVKGHNACEHQQVFFRAGAKGLRTNAQVLGEHYFLSEEGVRDFCEQHGIDAVNRKGHVAEDRENPRETESVDSAAEDVPIHQLHAKLIWNRLRQVGWHFRKGSGLEDYHWCRPGARTIGEGSICGVDYFTSEKACIQFAKAQRIDGVKNTGQLPHLFADNDSDRDDE